MGILVPLFLFSGASALVYQVAWLRLLSLIVGVTVHAASAVLASFMGGLALGAWLGGRIADRSRQPLRAFGLVEIGIAVSALAVPFALDATESIYASLHAALPHNGILTLIRFTCAGAVLLVPTTLMGASLPLLARHVQNRAGIDDSIVGRIGALYAANTTGGIVGIIAAGYFSIGAYGVTTTTRAAAAINLALGLIALALGSSGAGATASAASTAPAAPTPGAAVTRTQAAVLALFAVTGFIGLALEVVWFRLLVLFIPATTYAFTTMLATVLLGIALGSAIASARLRRTIDPAAALARVQIAAGIAVLLSMTALAITYRLGWRTSGMIQACVVAMLPATTLMGAIFPFGFAVWLKQSAADVGARIGQLYAVNVLGAVAGALAGGFVLLPWLGARASLLLLAGLYVLSGIVLAWTTAPRARAIRIAAAGSVLLVIAAVTLPDLYDAVRVRRYGATDRVIFRADGVQTTVAVHDEASGARVMYLDGLHQANDTGPMIRLHSEIGALALALHPAPRRALVIGLGGGVTAGAVAADPRVQVDVVELARGVVEGAAHFAGVNYDVLRAPNVNVRIDDGRNHLWLTEERYDIVTADTIQPIHAGAGNLYSREYFELSKRVLRDGGVTVQWIGHREDQHYRLIMRTFLAAYPNATLWADGGIMIGSVEPLALDRQVFERRFPTPEARAPLEAAGLASFDALLARFTAGPDEMRRFVGDGPLLTDDRPLLEYHRSLRNSGPQVDLSSLRSDVAAHLKQ